MKRLIAAGLPKIFQLAQCFRNKGEYSEWHNPEFCMLEWYQVGQTYKGLIDETEEFLRFTADAMASITKVRPEDVLPARIERVRVEDAFLEFAGLKLIDQDPHFAQKARENGVLSVLPSDDFETAFFKVLIDRVEPAIARLGGCVLHDYPPSQAALAKVVGGWATRFEFYLGRVELCNGFYELTGLDENRARIHDAMIARERAGNEPVPIDKGFLTSMKSFTEPCAGNALGFDRWLAILTGAAGLDASMPFRMTERSRQFRY
jgi:lysyl-tRNA synthetase class 2